MSEQPRSGTREYYALNRKTILMTQRHRRHRNIERVREILLTMGCMDCPEKDPEVLDFDHVRGVKHLGVSELVNKGYAWKTVLAEIEKCEVRCSNCHRRRHTAERRKRRPSLRRRFRQVNP